MKWRAEEVAKIVGGRVRQGDPRRTAISVSTDSRSLRPGEGFVALKGKNFDGHAYAGAAIKKGAAWALVEQSARVQVADSRAAVIEVPDTLEALGRLAGAWRSRMPVKVAAITGSIGKSTTKEMVAEILAAKGRVLKNQGNLNNRIGLPLTLFKLNRGHRFAALEMGTNEPGEIGKLTAIAQPDAGLITRVAPAHLEGLGSLAGVAKAKAELIRGLPSGATFCLNLDDPRIAREARGFKGRIIGFTARPETDFAGERLALSGVEKEVRAGRPRIRFKIQEKRKGKAAGRPAEFYLTTLSAHNALNALAAAAMGRAFGVTLAEAASRLHRFEGLPGRGEVIRTRRGVFLMNDCYNASPEAVADALQTLAWWRGPRRGVALLGEMLELGGEAELYHRYIGERAAKTGAGFLVARGPHARAVIDGARAAGLARDRALIAADNRSALALLRANLQPGDWLLVKGSRGMALDEIVDALSR